MEATKASTSLLIEAKKTPSVLYRKSFTSYRKSHFAPQGEFNRISRAIFLTFQVTRCEAPRRSLTRHDRAPWRDVVGSALVTD